MKMCSQQWRTQRHWVPNLLFLGAKMHLLRYGSPCLSKEPFGGNAFNWSSTCQMSLSWTSSGWFAIQTGDACGTPEISQTEADGFWAIYKDLTRGHSKRWFSKGIPPKKLPKFRLRMYYLLYIAQNVKLPNASAFPKKGSERDGHSP